LKSSAFVIIWSQTLLRAQQNVQNRQHMHAHGGIRTNVTAIGPLHIYALDHTATGIGEFWIGGGKGDG
jgi:hypothetical protein